MSNKIIQIPHHISRTFIQQHPEYTFVYGQDHIRRGIMGQSWVCGGEPNCFPITTVQKLCPSGSRYLSDSNLEHEQWIEKDLDLVPRDKPIIVFRRIGEGCSRMKEFAPRLHAELKEVLFKISYKPIEIINTTL